MHKEGIGVVATLGKGRSFGEVTYHLIILSSCSPCTQVALQGNDLRTATVAAKEGNVVEVFSLHKV